MGEKRYYSLVRKWLENQGYYCGGFIYEKGKPYYFQNKGTARLRIDVAGIKNVGSSVEDEIEVVAIEVRDVDKVQLRDIQDANAYSQYAHKCYLATTGLIDEQDKEDARKLGIGLLEIKDKKVKEVLSPQSKQPEYAQMMRLLNVLEVARCPICGCFFETYIVKENKDRSFYKLIRPKYFKVAHDHPRVDALDSRELQKLPPEYKIFRFICKACMKEFFPQKLKHREK